MTILITGGSGFMGRNLIPYLIRQYPNYKIVNFDLSDWELDKVQYQLVAGDIRNQELVNKTFKEHKPEIIINLAYDEPDSDIKSAETNFCGQQVLLQASIEHKIKKYIYLSSDSVYEQFVDELTSKPVLESEVKDIKSINSAHRLAAESLVLAHHYAFELPVYVVRSADCLGPNLKPRSLIALFIHNALQERSIPLINEGKQTQDWLDVKDTCQAIDAIMHHSFNKAEILNLGLGIQHSHLDTAKLILSQLDKSESLIQFVQSPKPDYAKPALDCAKAKTIINWKPEITFAEAIKKTIEWVKNHEIE